MAFRPGDGGAAACRIPAICFAPLSRPGGLALLAGAGGNLANSQVGCYYDVAVMLHREVRKLAVILHEYPERSSTIGGSYKPFDIRRLVLHLPIQGIIHEHLVA